MFHQCTIYTKQSAWRCEWHVKPLIQSAMWGNEFFFSQWKCCFVIPFDNLCETLTQQSAISLFQVQHYWFAGWWWEWRWCDAMWWENSLLSKYEIQTVEDMQRFIHLLSQFIEIKKLLAWKWVASSSFCSSWIFCLECRDNMRLWYIFLHIQQQLCEKNNIKKYVKRHPSLIISSNIFSPL